MNRVRNRLDRTGVQICDDLYQKRGRQRTASLIGSSHSRSMTPLLRRNSNAPPPLIPKQRPPLNRRNSLSEHVKRCLDFSGENQVLHTRNEFGKSPTRLHDQPHRRFSFGRVCKDLSESIDSTAADEEINAMSFGFSGRFRRVMLFPVQEMSKDNDRKMEKELSSCSN
uniref:Uncharacterized protein n=1 Tax=Spongospora subterranea TaxID=70186 RepID=A0A0H5RN97_9EUKA|eukprot:CRZ10214.1 hypothetical protein [Spongospora subterranea]